MSMGWTFTSFDWSAWSEWTRGSLPPARAAAIRAASLEDAEWLTPAEAQAMERLAERVSQVGLESAYREAASSELADLDRLVASLMGSDQLERELHPLGHLDPWGWNAIEALVGRVAPASPARLLLTGRRPAVATVPAPSSGEACVIFTPSEAKSLAADLGSALQGDTNEKLASWEVEEFASAMGEIAAESGRGRALFAHYG